MSEWQSIETAPKNGTWILVNDPEGVADSLSCESAYDIERAPRLHVFMAQWVEKEWIACFGEVDGWGCPSGGYDHWVAGLIAKPTHWMPLPAPPAEEDSRQSREDNGQFGKGA